MRLTPSTSGSRGRYSYERLTAEQDFLLGGERGAEDRAGKVETV